MRCQFLRLVTLPGVRIGALLTVVAAPLLALAVAQANPRAGVAAVLAATLVWTQAGSVVVGAVAGGAAYEGGEIGTSLRACPRRHVHAARAWGAFALLAVVVGLAVALAAVAVPWALGSTGWLALPLLGTAVHGAVAAALGYAFATVARSAAGGVGLGLIVVWALPMLLAPWPALLRLLPSVAAGHLVTGTGDPVSTLTLLSWLLAAVAASGGAVVVRDA